MIVKELIGRQSSNNSTISPRLTLHTVGDIGDRQGRAQESIAEYKKALRANLRRRAVRSRSWLRQHFVASWG